MRDNRDVRSVKDLLLENEELQARIDFLQRIVNGLRFHNQDLTEERNKLQTKYDNLRKEYNEFYEKEYMTRIDECNRLWGELFDIKHMSVWEFADKYCNDEELEEAGHALARSLLGGH